MSETEGPLPTLAYWGLIGTVLGAVVGVILGRQFRGALAGGFIGLFVGAVEYSRAHNLRT